MGEQDLVFTISLKETVKIGLQVFRHGDCRFKNRVGNLDQLQSIKQSCLVNLILYSDRILSRFDSSLGFAFEVSCDYSERSSAFAPSILKRSYLTGALTRFKGGQSLEFSKPSMNTSPLLIDRVA